MDFVGKEKVMAIGLWKLPEGLGGAVVNPSQALSPELATLRKVRVPGTEWTVYVPAGCLVPVLPDEPPVNSVVLVLSSTGLNWQLYVRQSMGGHAVPGRWSAPGNSGVIHTWQDIHTNWDRVHVLLWWDADEAAAGAVVRGGRNDMEITATTDAEPGLAMVRVTGGVGSRVFVDQEEAIRGAAALLGLALKERM